MGNEMKLLIVESPTKAKTLTKYLPDYKVVASNGHIIDLPAKSFGVDVENNFKPNYEVIEGKQQIIAMLKKEAAEADEIFIGSDPDREGEAIAHHIASLFQDKLIHRVLFHEITKNAVLKAIDNYSEINEDLFNAQQARRILDRIVGYKLSAFLWRSVKKGLSAGRVQSVALQMVTEREKEIRAFVPEEYWSFKGDFSGKNGIFDAALEKVDGKKVAVSNEAEAKKLKAEIDKASGFSVISVEKREKKESPLPPLNTSNLQQESSRLFNYTGEQTMKIAQSLYEGKNLGAEGFTGLITYMRTDSFRISDEANDALRKYIAGNIGSQFLSEEVRYYKNQTRSKGKIQDAHEAIRPTNVELTPEKVASKLTKDELNIYTLIWRRFIATQMKDAILETTTVTVEDSAHRYSFKKSGSVVQFEGYRKIYKKQSKDDTIPKVDEGESIALSELEIEQHFTKPTPRFTEGSLVKELEEKGVGRPSTYATVIKQIVQRSYIERMKEPRGALMATDLGILVGDTLDEFFPEIINVNFTAEMESDLDTIESGEKDWCEVIRGFYGTFVRVLEKSVDRVKNEGKKRIYAEELCPKCGKRLVVRWSKKGNQPFLSCESYPTCDFSCSLEKNGDIVHMKNDEPATEVELEEVCPNCGSKLVIKHGRFGDFKACSAYPKCKTIVKEEKKICQCPQCHEGYVTAKRSKKGRPFYGCSRYPECDFVSWYKPVEGEKCPECGFEYVVEKKRSGKVCQKCGYKFDEKAGSDKESKE